MASEPLKTTDTNERSPQEAARARLSHALSHLERAVQQRLKDAQAIESAAQDDTRWQETVDALEAESRSLKQENARLAEALKTAEGKPATDHDVTTLSNAVRDVSTALDDAIVSVEKILKG